MKIPTGPGGFIPTPNTLLLRALRAYEAIDCPLIDKWPAALRGGGDDPQIPMIIVEG